MNPCQCASSPNRFVEQRQTTTKESAMPAGRKKRRSSLQVHSFLRTKYKIDILECAHEGNVDALENVLECNWTEVDKRSLHCGKTSLHIAATRGHLKFLNRLLDAKADINSREHVNKYTPLHLAVRNGMGEIVESLLLRGAKGDLRSKHHFWTPLHLACAKTDPKMVDILLKFVYSRKRNHKAVKSPSVDDIDVRGRSALHIVCSRSDVDEERAEVVISKLVDAGANIFLRDCNGRIPLHLACENGLLRLVRLFVRLSEEKEECRNILDEMTSFKNTPLEVSLASKQYHVAEYILKKVKVDTSS
eukprot:g1195.t1